MSGFDPASPDSTFSGWDKLDWKERRRRRFDKWRAARTVQFVSDAARQAYDERIQIFIDALELRKPARVPVNGVMGFYPTRFGGLTLKEAMYDYEKAAAAWISFYDYFQPDYQSMPVPPAPVYDLLGLQFVQWPGHGIGENTPWQYLEGEYMKAEDYDALIADPSDYFRTTFLPRIGSAFAPLATLDSFANIMEASMMAVNVLPFANPAVLQAVQQLAQAAQESLRWLMTLGAANADAGARLGIPPMAGAMGKAPYDVLADTLRGTRGIVMDRFRQPEKILEAAQRLQPLMIRWILGQVAVGEAPICIFVLHKGADGFMSDADFRTFYWPTLKAVMLGLIEQGVVPLMFAEGGYNSRLQAIADDDLPAGSVIWLFDQTDNGGSQADPARACVHRRQRAQLAARGWHDAGYGAVRERSARHLCHGRWLHADERRGGRRRQAGNAQSHDRHGTQLARVKRGPKAGTRDRLGVKIAAKCVLPGLFWLLVHLTSAGGGR